MSAVTVLAGHAGRLPDREASGHPNSADQFSYSLVHSLASVGYLSHERNARRMDGVITYNMIKHHLLYVVLLFVYNFWPVPARGDL